MKQKKQNKAICGTQKFQASRPLENFLRAAKRLESPAAGILQGIATGKNSKNLQGGMHGAVMRGLQASTNAGRCRNVSSMPSS